MNWLCEKAGRISPQRNKTLNSSALVFLVSIPKEKQKSSNEMVKLNVINRGIWVLTNPRLTSKNNTHGFAHWVEK